MKSNFKNTINLIQRASTNPIIIEILSKYPMIGDVISKTNSDEIWSEILTFLRQKYPNPEFTTLYFARRELGVTDRIIKRFNTKIINGEPIIRSIGSDGNTKYAIPDIKMIGQFRELIQELEDKEVFKKQVINGREKYLVLDSHEKGITTDEYLIKILHAYKKSIFGDIYDFIPKSLTLDEKIELLKKNHQ
jgi:hypothetical protein